MPVISVLQTQNVTRRPIGQFSEGANAALWSIHTNFGDHGSPAPTEPIQGHNNSMNI